MLRRATGRHRATLTLGGVLLPALLLLPAACGGRTDPTPVGATFDAAGRPLYPLEVPAALPNLVLVVIDSLRADALGAEGELPGGERMPFLASLAAKGASFSTAFAPAPWTLPSMTSLLTGLLPEDHGMTAMRQDRALVPPVVTYAEVLARSYGYETAAFVDGPWFRKECESVLQGFTHRETTFGLPGVAERVARWDRERDRGRPFFLLLHVNDAHCPYGAANHPWPPRKPVPAPVDPALLDPGADPAALFKASHVDQDLWRGLQVAMGDLVLQEKLLDYRTRGYAARPDPDLVRDLAAAYWEGVRWVDGNLEKAVGTLQDLGLLADSLLVVTSDHGEAFGEHLALGHGRVLTDEVIRVPLVFHGLDPFHGGLALDGTIGLVDVLPTFFDLVGLVPPAGTDGRSALPLLADPGRCRPVVSEERLTRENSSIGEDALLVAARTDRWTYRVRYDFKSGEAREEVYDRWSDPDEARDLAGGTGRLPDGLVLDACLCPAIEAVRGRIWGVPAVGAGAVDPGEGSRAHPTTPPPAPCGVGSD